MYKRYRICFGEVCLIRLWVIIYHVVNTVELLIGNDVNNLVCVVLGMMFLLFWLNMIIAEMSLIAENH